MTDPRNRQYTNGEITVFWIPSKCIHATTCFRELIEVFNPGRRPWVNMDGAPTRRIVEVVNKCPTQALVWKSNTDLTEAEEASQWQEKKEEENPSTVIQAESKARAKPTSVRIMKDGPIVAEGDFRILNGKDEELKTTPMTSFCRCGESHSMPYCDGRHRKVAFSDE